MDGTQELEPGPEGSAATPTPPQRTGAVHSSSKTSSGVNVSVLPGRQHVCGRQNIASRRSAGDNILQEDGTQVRQSSPCDRTASQSSLSTPTSSPRRRPGRMDQQRGCTADYGLVQWKTLVRRGVDLFSQQLRPAEEHRW